MHKNSIHGLSNYFFSSINIYLLLYLNNLQVMAKEFGVNLQMLKDLYEDGHMDKTIQKSDETFHTELTRFNLSYSVSSFQSLQICF